MKKIIYITYVFTIISICISLILEAMILSMTAGLGSERWGLWFPLIVWSPIIPLGTLYFLKVERQKMKEKERNRHEIEALIISSIMFLYFIISAFVFFTFSIFL